jgi:hypothetical protein
MTRRDFNLIASVIRDVDENAPLDEATLAYVVQAFVAALATTNPRFDRARFERACQP